MSASRRPNRPGGRSTGPGRTRAARRAASSSTVRPKAKRIRARAQRKISRRAAVLALVLSALALAYAYPLRTYVEQRIQINRTEAEQAEQREYIEELTAERLKWEDPEFVKARIRFSLHLVEPGEDLVLIVEDEDPTSPGEADDETESDRAWYDELTATFEETDRLDSEETEETQE